MKQVIKHV